MGEITEGLIAAGGCLAKIDESVGVPAVGSLLEAGAPVGEGCGERGGDQAKIFTEGGEDGVFSDVAEPVFGVGVVGFAAVHDSVPVVSRLMETSPFDALGRCVAGVEVVVELKKTGSEGYGIGFGGEAGDELVQGEVDNEPTERSELREGGDGSEFGGGGEKLGPIGDGRGLRGEVYFSS